MKTKRHAVTVLRGITLAVTLSLAPAATLWADPVTAAAPPPPSMAVVQAAYGHLPLSFEANQGQWDSSVQFLTHGRGYTLFLTPSDAVLTLKTGEAKATGREGKVHQGTPSSSPPPPSHSVVRMTFKGANPQAEMVGLDQLPGIVNYIIGADSSKWRTNIPTYQKVAYTNVYPGIDLVYYGNQGQLEYDLIVAPGADPTQIRLAFDGAEQIKVDQHGDLVLTMPSSSTDAAAGDAATIRLQKPVVYQRDEQGEKHLLAGTYVLLASEPTPARPTPAVLDPSEPPSPLTPHVAFQLAAYDASQPLIIDPVLSWATYLGGSNQDTGNGVAVDAAGNAYVTGLTNSANFPGTAGSLIQNTYAGGFSDAFVTKLNAAGTALVYSTYLGGGEKDYGNGVAVDAAGNAYVTGSTNSANFPGTAGSLIQNTYAGGFSDAFVTKLNAAGTALVYSTYLGGLEGDSGQGIAVDQAGSAYVTGSTQGGFPGTTSSSIQSTYAGGFSGGDAFVAKLNAAGTALVYSTYLGGIFDDRGEGVAVDAAGNAYVIGTTFSSDFPGTAGSLIQSTYGGTGVLYDAFVTKLNAAGTALVYSTYLGGIGDDRGQGVAVDAAGNAYVTGWTASTNFPGTAGSLIQNTIGKNVFGVIPCSGFADCPSDVFVTKLNAAGTALVYSTYLGGGGSGTDSGNGIAVDQAGSAYVIGTTQGGFPRTTSSSIQSTFAGGDYDAFVAKISDSPTNKPPVCSAAQANPAALWSPNHQFVPIAVNGVTDPDGNAVTITITGVTQDEPVNAKGDGNTSPDAVIQAGSASVRAERSGNGNGRVYQISFKADDGKGDSCTGVVTVGVPHSQGKGVTAIDDGPIYDSTVP